MKTSLNELNLKYIFFQLLKNKIRIIFSCLLIFIIILVFGFYYIQRDIQNLSRVDAYVKLPYFSYQKIEVVKKKFKENINLNTVDIILTQVDFFNQFVQYIEYPTNFSEYIYLEQKKYNLKFDDLLEAKKFTNNNFKYLKSREGDRIFLNYPSAIDGPKLLDDYYNFVTLNLTNKFVTEVLDRASVIQVDLINNLEIAKKLNIIFPLLETSQKNDDSYREGTVALLSKIENNQKTIDSIKNYNFQINDQVSNQVVQNLLPKPQLIFLSFLLSLSISLFINLIIIFLRYKK
jgi:hypothetical protein